MPARVLNRQIRKVLIHVEERRALDVAGEVQLASARRAPELPATVDELDAQRAVSVSRVIGGRVHGFSVLGLAALCSVALVVAGCGGSGGVSKDEYRSELTKISKESGKAHQALEQGAPLAKSVAQVQKLLRDFAVAEDKIGDEVSNLKVPDDAKDANAELAKAQHDDAAEIRAILPKLDKFKSVQQAFGFLQRLGSSKGGREGDEAIAKLKKLGYTSGS